MKKYLLSSFAIVLAIALNAFTTPKKISVQSLGTDLVWYHVNGSGEIDPGDPINYDEPMDSDEFKSAFPATCVGSGVACVRGFLFSALPENSDDEGQEDIEKNL